MASTLQVQRPSFVLTPRYELRGELERGSLGVILRAFNVEALGPVLIKTLRPEVADDPELRARLIGQGNDLARVRHTNVAQILEVVGGESPFYVMAAHEGARSLADLMARGRAPAGAIAAIGVGLARGLAAIHAAGLVHGDLRPETVQVVRGRPIVLDLALARSLNEFSRAMGVRPASDHAAPEVMSGDAVTPRADLYSLGVILHELACGQSFFRGGDSIETMRRHLEEKPPSLRTERPDLTPAFDALVRKLLAKDAADRPVSAALVATRIETALGISP